MLSVVKNLADIHQLKHRILLALGSGAVLALASALLVSGTADERRMSVYSKVANYALPVVQRNGEDYVGILEVLEPLGTVNAKFEKKHWKFRYNDTECEFNPGKPRVKVQNANFDLTNNFLFENGRGLVPLSSLASLLPRILGGPVTFNQAGRRLFVGNVAVHFTAEANSSTPPSLVMNFTSPVNPTIATEPGKLRMTFNREAVVSPGSPLLTFNSKTIQSATFEESNGSAELVVNSSVPVIASFSNDGRTITIAPPGPPPSSRVVPPAAGATSPPTENTAQPPTEVQPHSQRYFAVIDAAHGGSERGAALTEQLGEKDITMVLARRLRQELIARGLTTMLVRDGDDTLTADQRAARTNSANAAIYICLHATSVENGIRLYTALVPAPISNQGPFVDWNTAQSAFAQMSQIADDGVGAALRSKQFSVRMLSAPLRPLTNIMSAAIAIEVGPSGGDVTQLTSPEFQQTVISAIATGITGIRDKLVSARR